MLQADADAPTQTRVAASIMANGPSTAAELAVRMGLTPAAVRRHLGVLLAEGMILARPQRTYGQRGRGRPALEYVLTDTGRSSFYQAYDAMAIDAIGFLLESGDEAAVDRLAERRFGEVEGEFRRMRAEDPDADPVSTLASALSEAGYASTVRPAVLGDQLCQFHCPVAHVAARFPQLCEAETRLFARLLGSHVQRLATIAHGDGVCTTHVPQPGTTSHHDRALTEQPSRG